MVVAEDALIAGAGTVEAEASHARMRKIVEGPGHALAVVVMCGEIADGGIAISDQLRAMPTAAAAAAARAHCHAALLAPQVRLRARPQVRCLALNLTAPGTAGTAAMTRRAAAVAAHLTLTIGAAVTAAAGIEAIATGLHRDTRAASGRGMGRAVDDPRRELQGAYRSKPVAAIRKRHRCLGHARNQGRGRRLLASQASGLRSGHDPDLHPMHAAATSMVVAMTLRVMHCTLQGPSRSRHPRSPRTRKSLLPWQLNTQPTPLLLRPLRLQLPQWPMPPPLL